MVISQPLKYHGGKAALASKIVALLPPHLMYCEPFAGGLSVLLAKDGEGVSEVVNDLSLDLTGFWRVLQGGDSFAAFLRLREATPFSESEWGDADIEFAEFPLPDEQISCSVTRAWKFFIHCRQSLAGRMKSFTPISTSRTRRGMNEQVSAWLTAVEGLPEVHKRLKRVLILNRDAVTVCKQFDKPDTVIYCDSPYHPSTRTSPDVYEHEMIHEDHVRYLDTLNSLEHAKVAVSGYDCPLYAEKLANWRRIDWESPNHAAGGKVKRVMVESLWLNYEPPISP